MKRGTIKKAKKTFKGILSLKLFIVYCG
ncbi:hypothetical protein BTTAP_120090 [Brochothrix thermosphacta]|nr:hypothetical protein BTTAP_120090 [Brochothrix thermosphacta]